MTDLAASFANCTTIRDANAQYKDLFWEQGCGSDPYGAKANDLREALRRASERIIHGQREDAAAATSDPDKISNRRLRNWAHEQGIPLRVKGKVPQSVENAYREAHDMPVVKKSRCVVKPVVGVPASVIRAWATDNGIEVGKRGRVHPDVIAQYVEANA